MASEKCFWTLLPPPAAALLDPGPRAGGRALRAPLVRHFAPGPRAGKGAL